MSVTDPTRNYAREDEHEQLEAALAKEAIAAHEANVAMAEDVQGDTCGQSEPSTVPDIHMQNAQAEHRFFQRIRCLELAVGLHTNRALRPAYKDSKNAALAEEMVSDTVSSAFVFYQFAIGALDEDALLSEDD